jgi:hypothetical protein
MSSFDAHIIADPQVHACAISHPAAVQCAACENAQPCAVVVRPTDIVGRWSPTKNKKETTMSNYKKVLTIAFAAAVALTTSSLALTSHAHAKGLAGGGGKAVAGVSRIPVGGRHLAFYRGIYFSAPGYVSCWRWIGGKRVFICY